MKVCHYTLILSLFSFGALSATITLYRVAPPTLTAIGPNPRISVGGSFTVSPVGVGEDGKTTYVEEGIVTEVVDIFSDSSTTLNPLPTTYTVTFEEDSLGFFRQSSISDSVLSTDRLGKQVQSCNFQGTTAGSCVEFVDFPGNAGTFSTSYSGSLIPAYTLTETANIPGQTQDSGVLTHSSIWDTYQLIGLLFGMWATLLVF